MKKYFQAPWGFKDLIVISLFSGILLLAYVAGLYFFEIKNYLKDEDLKSFYLLGILILQWTALLLPLLIFTAKKYKLKWEHFGFNKTGILKTLGLVIGFYFLYIGITLIISLISIYNNVKIPGYQIQESVLPLFGTDILGLVIAGGAIILLAPLIEEILFRGFLLRTLVNKIGVMWGSIVSALIFAILHVPWQSIIPIFILGLILNSLVIRSKSLIPAIGFHVLNNAITFVIQILIEKGVISLV